MGLVKTRPRLAEDGSPYQAARKCCQCGSVASSNVANFQLGIGIGSCGAPGAHLRFSPCVLRLETTRTTGKNNLERGARANSPAHLSSDVCMNPYIIVSFLIGLWVRAS